MIYDLIIIGMGPAGVTSAIYAKRAGLNVLCLEKGMVGGYLNFIDIIDNYPGFSRVTGPELAFKFYEQVKQLEIQCNNEEALDITVVGDLKHVKTKKNEYLTKHVIIATGRISKKLGLENEDILLGRGLSHCALCDGALYKGKEVAVVGGGESALTEAIYLSNICSKVYLIHRRDEFKATPELISKVLDKDNIVIKYKSLVTSLNMNGDRLESVIINDCEKLNIACLFSYVGYVPGTKFAVNLGLTNKEGYIEVNDKYETKVEGIYAVGDIIKKEMYQIVTATAEGALASNEVLKKLKNK